MSELRENIEEVLDEDQALPDPDLIEMDSGVILRAKVVPILLIRKLETQFTEPKVPRVYLEEKERWEYNPQDPEYLRDMEEWEAKKNNAYLGVFAAYGTEIESIPSGTPGVMDDSWAEEFSPIYGEDIPDQYNKKRYLAWLECVAIHTAKDLNRISDAVRNKMGVSQEDVDQQIQKFPNDS